MALDTSLLLVPGTGSIWTGVVGTATKPTLAQLNTYASAGTVPSGWTDIGATSADDLPAPGRDGGDTNSLYIWNATSPVRTTTEQTTDFWDVNVVQVDNSNLSLYYGGGNIATANEFAAPTAPAPTQKAVTFVINDGGAVIAQYNPKMEIIGTDEITLDREDFMVVPLHFTRLAPASGAPFFWIGARFGTP
jgi:hypothetical protein